MPNGEESVILGRMTFVKYNPTSSVLTKLQWETINVVTTEYITELCYNRDIDIELAWFTFQQSKEVDWTVIDREMGD